MNMTLNNRVNPALKKKNSTAIMYTTVGLCTAGLLNACAEKEPDKRRAPHAKVKINRTNNIHPIIINKPQRPQNPDDSHTHPMQNHVKGAADKAPSASKSTAQNKLPHNGRSTNDSQSPLNTDNSNSAEKVSP